MKYLKTSAICMGLILPILSSAQVAVSPANTSPTQNGGNSTFHNLIVAMQSDETDLRTTEGESLSVTSPIYFNHAVIPGTPSFFVNVDWDATMGGPSTIEFVKVGNFSGFDFAAGGTLDIGFIGEESNNNNELGFDEGGSYTKLFDYNAGGQNPPMSYQLTTGAATTISFEHRNLSQPAAGQIGMQSDPNRFRIYRGTDGAGGFTNEYLFAIADRSATMDADFDDGFFYLVGDITPVPEPAHIAGLALLGLGGLLYVRRRIRK
jgi:hypothetical protein